MTQDTWTQTTLWKITEIIWWWTPSTDISDYWWSDIPWITPKDLSSHQNVWIKKWERSISKSWLVNSSARLLPKNSILFSSRAPIGYLAIAENELSTNQWFKSLICYDSICDYKFIYYWLKNNAKNIEKLAVGSTFAEVSGWLMSSIEILLPPLPEQRAIANILSSLDIKIELLREQKETLEKTAQTIFHEWFGKYTINDELPEGWKVGKLSEIATFLNWIALQKFPPENEIDYLPVIKIRELKAGIGEWSDKASTSIDPKYIIENGDILFSWSGSLEVVIWQYWKWALNQHLFKVSSEKYKKWFYYLWTLYHLQEFKEIAANKATTMWHIQRHHIDQAIIIIPDNQRLEEMNAIFEPILQKIMLVNSQIQSLSKTRDELLPRLMSGEVKVD